MKLGAIRQKSKLLSLLGNWSVQVLRSISGTILDKFKVYIRLINAFFPSLI